MAKVVKVKKKDIKTVYGTGKSYLQKDKPYQVHSLVAEKLVKLGAASLTLKGKKDEQTDAV